MAQGHQRQQPQRRRSPLVVGVVAAFLLACAAVVVVVITRVPGRSTAQTIRSGEFGDSGNDAVAAAANNGQAIVDVGRTTRVTHDAGAVEVPQWARSPGIWTTPYPEGGRYNPPLPAVKLPPGMVGEAPGSSDAGASLDAGASADGQQLDVVDQRALR